MHTWAKLSQQSLKVMTTERAGSMARTTTAPVLPGRPVPPVFRKVHDFADILDIRRRDKDKMITLPERYRYLPEHTGAIRATVLAGLTALPTGPVIAPQPPPTIIPIARDVGTPPPPGGGTGGGGSSGGSGGGGSSGGRGDGGDGSGGGGGSEPGARHPGVETNNRLGERVSGAQVLHQEKGKGKENREHYWTIQW